MGTNSNTVPSEISSENGNLTVIRLSGHKKSSSLKPKIFTLIDQNYIMLMTMMTIYSQQQY
uniref:Uncharacterized protein n=1 Tax=Romanomermis culicivorax TaxID=13658 RepID=A0A915HPX0_ROMCU